MSDKLVFDLSQEIEGSPSVFIRKDWLNILDNQNQNYNNNQSIIDTSQLSNSNKWMNYREAYFLIPFNITLGQTTGVSAAGSTVPVWGAAETLAGGGVSVDYSIGLKNWFGQIIHSFTLDYNGTTIIQQTPFVNMWNSFKLLTSLSYNDLLTQGALIGFYPDDATSWENNTNIIVVAATATGSPNGNGICNNTTGGGGGQAFNTVQVKYYNSFNSGQGNEGYIRRLQNINFNPAGIPSATLSNYHAGGVPDGVVGPAYNTLVSTAQLTNLWKSYIYNSAGIIHQIAITGIVYLKHIHSFFNMVPLLKGVFMKMTMNLNNTSCSISCCGTSGAGTVLTTLTSMTCTGVSNAVGGVNPLMISAPLIATQSAAGVVNTTAIAGSYNLFPTAGVVGNNVYGSVGYTACLSVGAVCLNQSLRSVAGYLDSPLSKSVYLYIPAYTFNPPFEQAYLSSPTKIIKYTDIYQYQILNIAGGTGQINNLVTNGIANIKSVLVVPFYSTNGVSTACTLPVQYGGSNLNLNTGFLNGVPVFQSPFDSAGTGTTSPLVFLTNFNIQVSGQNAIYNVEKYAFEQFNNQLYGQNSVNGGLTDGLCSGLIGRTEFDMNYNYYYVNVERMLPVEETVPKSIQIIGNNASLKAIDLFIFIEYGCEVKIDALTGARV